MTSIDGSLWTMNDVRLAYVTPYDIDYKSISVHTSRRLDFWRSSGAEVEVFVIGGGGRARRSALRNLAIDSVGSGSLVRQIREFAPTVIYRRWLTPIVGLNRGLARVAPVFLDIHADDVNLTGGGSALRTSYVRLLRSAEFSSLSGATFVVSELAKSPIFDAIPGRTGVFLNGNWIGVRDYEPRGRPRVGISVSGAHIWNGLDRFARLAEQLQSAAEWVVVCPAEQEASVRAEAGDCVTIVPTLGSTDYLAEVSSWSVAFGTMALEREGLRTASPLKVRDYVGLGVPTVLPYWDEGLEGVEDPLVMKLAGPADAPIESPPVSKIARFIASAHGRNLARATSEAMAGASIEARRLAFLTQG